MTKGLVYYSDCRGDEQILHAVRRQLLRSRNGHPLVSVTLQPVPGFGENIVLPLERSRLTMFKQILAGLQCLDTDVAFLVEHDVLYNDSHFAFDPPHNIYCYNRNTWRLDAATGQALFYLCDQTSGLCAERTVLLDHYQKRVERTEREGYNHRTGYEPGKHHPPNGIDCVPVLTWWSQRPLVDIRHQYNLTANRWRQDQFRDPMTCLGWKMADEIPGWGPTKDRFREFLQEVTT